MSARPGMTNFPRPSMRVAPAGTVTLDDGPMAAMRPSRITIVASRMIESRPVIGMAVAPTIADTPGESAVRDVWARAIDGTVMPRRRIFRGFIDMWRSWANAQRIVERRAFTSLEDY